MKGHHIAALCGLTLAAPAAWPQAADDPPIEPFIAHYTADWRSINVGTSDLELEHDTRPGDYVYKWTVTARGVFRLLYANDVVQTSWLSVHSAHARPERYRAEDGKSTVHLSFDWAAGRARGESENKPLDLQITQGTQDIMSIQVEVMLDLKHGNLPKTFRILDKDQVKQFDYTLEGPARLRTALGELDTLVVASQRTGNDRILRMWFAPNLGYIPVLAERSRNGKLEFAMKIKSLEAKPAPVAKR